MNKIYVNDMNLDMLENVFNHNTGLQTEVLDHMLETEGIFVQEQLECFKNSLSDWSIGALGRNYLRVADGLESEFLSGLEKMEDSIPLLTKDSQTVFKKALELEGKYRDTSADSDEFENLEAEYLHTIEELAYMVATDMQSQFDECFNRDTQLAYFTDFYQELNLENCYIEEENGAIDYTLKKDISYTKSYK